MGKDRERAEVHMGDNVRIFRLWRKLSQEDLAELLGDKIQCQVSQLEKKTTIDKEALEAVAKALKIDVDFLETFSFEKFLERIYFEQHNNTGSENVNPVVAKEYENNSVPFSEVEKLVNEIRKLDRQVAVMRYLLDVNKIDYSPERD